MVLPAAFLGEIAAELTVFGGPANSHSIPTKQ